jgi:hypothetical protein
MKFGAEQCGCVLEAWIVSGEGFTNEEAAKCGQENWLSGGVHLI